MSAHKPGRRELLQRCKDSREYGDVLKSTTLLIWLNHPGDINRRGTHSTRETEVPILSLILFQLLEDLRTSLFLFIFSDVSNCFKRFMRDNTIICKYRRQSGTVIAFLHIKLIAFEYICQHSHQCSDSKCRLAEIFISLYKMISSWGSNANLGDQMQI